MEVGQNLGKTNTSTYHLPTKNIPQKSLLFTQTIFHPFLDHAPTARPLPLATCVPRTSRCGRSRGSAAPKAPGGWLYSCFLNGVPVVYAVSLSHPGLLHERNQQQQNLSSTQSNHPVAICCGSPQQKTTREERWNDSSPSQRNEAGEAPHGAWVSDIMCLQHTGGHCQRYCYPMVCEEAQNGDHTHADLAKGGGSAEKPSILFPIPFLNCCRVWFSLCFFFQPVHHMTCCSTQIVKGSVIRGEIL